MTTRYPLVVNGTAIQELQAGDSLGGVLADLTGTSETVGGTAVVGVATTAARSDHKHAITNPAIDTLAAATDITTLNASTTSHGLVIKATAPAAGLYNYVGITNGETAYTNKALFDATAPSTQAFGDAAGTGSAVVAARCDHKHAMPAAPTSVSGNAGTVTNGLYTTGGTLTGQLISTKSNDSSQGGAQLYLNGATGNRIDFSGSGSGVPTFTTRSVGTKLCLAPNMSASSVDYAIGMASSELWASVTTTAETFKWYGGTTVAASLTGGGDFTAFGQMAVGGAVQATVNLSILGDFKGPTGGVGFYCAPTITPGDDWVAYFNSAISSSAASYTCTSAAHFLAQQNTLGAGSVLTSQFGFSADSSMVGATNNYGFYGGIPAGTGRYNLYMGGTALNYLAGSTQISSLGIGTSASGTAGEIRATNNITAYYSDERLKDNITPIPDALNKVMAISGVTFNSNELAGSFGYTDKKQQVGVIAQEVQKVLPHVVVPAPFDIEMDYENDTSFSKSGENYLTVQYEKIIPLLIEAIKELKNEVDVLKVELNSNKQIFYGDLL